MVYIFLYYVFKSLTSFRAICYFHSKKHTNRTPNGRQYDGNFDKFVRKHLVVIILFYVLMVAATNG